MANGLDHDQAKLDRVGREKRNVSGEESVTSLLRWKNELLAYRRGLDDEIEATETEIERRMECHAFRARTG